jgi:hypothetical protein
MNAPTQTTPLRPGWPEAIVAVLVSAVLTIVGMTASILIPDNAVLLRGHRDFLVAGLAPLIGFAAAVSLRIRDLRPFGFRLTPLGEEAVFRGVLLNFLGRWGSWVAVPLSAAIFALAHGINNVLPMGVPRRDLCRAAAHRDAFDLACHRRAPKGMLYHGPAELHRGPVVMRSLSHWVQVGAPSARSAERVQVRVHLVCSRSLICSKSIVSPKPGVWNRSRAYAHSTGISVSLLRLHLKCPW